MTNSYSASGPEQQRDEWTGPAASPAEASSYPLRVRVSVPAADLGVTLAGMLTWLHQELGEGDMARYAGMTLGAEAVTIYVHRSEDRARFLEAFPILEVANTTT